MPARDDRRRLPGAVAGRRLSRRAVLHLAGLAALSPTTACGVSPPGLQAAPLRSLPAVEVALTARHVSWELAPGKVITAWTYNGTVPGEAIRVREGDRVRVVLTNQLTEPTTIHWHGIDVPTSMDGVPDLSQPAVPPGATFVYEFDARPAGTRWYHTHVNSARQLDLGLSAPLIIEPAAAEAAAEREYTLVLDDWVASPSPPTTTPHGGRKGGGMMGRGMMGSGMMGSSGPAYDTFTINGKAFPATAPLIVKHGERVRLRLINASSMQTFALRLAGHRLQVTHTDGNPLQTPVAVDVVPIAPSERYDVMVVADNPGRWPLYALDPVHRQGGLKTLVVYEGVDAAPAAEVPAAERGLRVWSYALGQGRDVLPPATGRGGSHHLTVAGGMMMDPDRWTINGRVYPQTETLTAGLNQLIGLHLVNMSMQAYPFHLHGQSFRVVRIGDQALPAPLVKDSVDVPAMMGTVDLEFVAANAGDWLFHCHKPMHMDGGMAMLVKIH